MPSFAERVQQLCKDVIACDTEAEAMERTRQLQMLMHERIELLRGNLAHLPMHSNPLDNPT
jgi:hypothetical protein